MEIRGRLKQPTVQEVIDIVCEQVGYSGNLDLVALYM